MQKYSKGGEIMADGVWRTVKGRRIFIEEGQSLTEAMKKSGKFEDLKNKKIEFNNRKNLVSAVKEQIDVDLEKAATERQFAPRRGLNIDSRKLEKNEFSSLKTFLYKHKITMQENGVYDYFINYKK